MDWMANVFSLERSVFACILKLILDPAKIINNYWLGNRGYYPSPGKVFFYGLALAALHIAYINTELLGLTMEFTGVQTQLFFWAFFFPFLTLASLAAFIPKKQPLTKHLISLTYLASSFFIIVTLIQDFLILISKDYLEGWAFFVFLGLLVIWNARVMVDSRKFSQIILYSALQALIFIILVIICGGIVYLKNPESLKINTPPEDAVESVE